MKNAFYLTILIAGLLTAGCGKDHDPVAEQTTPKTETPTPATDPATPNAVNTVQDPRFPTPEGPAPDNPAVTPQGNAGPSGFVPAGYRLAWADEFDYEGLPDTSKWDYQIGGYGWTAKEMQNYLRADPDNVGVENGTLRITAHQEKAGRNPYTSTRLVTKNKAEVNRGYVEVRAQVPSGPGLRSSFWMVGDTVTNIGWPNAGEIDVFEHYGKFPTVMNAAVQTHDNSWDKRNQQGGSVIVKDCETAFNVYSCEWTDEAISFAVNGEVYYTYPAPAFKSWRNYPFRWPFYMAATLAVGGIRGPQTAPVPEAFPANMYIDYVRVYEKK